MTIACRTIEAAGEALGVLIQANLRLNRDFHIGPLDGTKPLHIAVLVDLPADILRQLRAVPGATIT
jgi:hypothetical protein